MLKRALITGIAGQDGSYLADALLSRGYEVYGIDLPEIVSIGVPGNLVSSFPRLRLHGVSLTDASSVTALVSSVAPNECYHVGAASFVSYAFDQETSILSSNLTGTHNLLAAIKSSAPDCRVFFAGTSEMFGRVDKEPQDETTPFLPRSVYGISKVAGHHLMEYYRREHGLFTCTGILYNHESPRRGANFVTRKITMAAARIKAGLERELRLGNLDARRDWGYAPDYVAAMQAMVMADKANDYVIASGTTHTVRDFVSLAFNHVGLDYRDFVVVDPAFYRETEAVTLCGDGRKIHRELGWKPTKNFADLVGEMVEHDLQLLKN